MRDMDPAALEELRDSAKADLAASSVGQALKLCIEATGREGCPLITTPDRFSTTTVA
jgi:hypothetical protein